MKRYVKVKKSAKAREMLLNYGFREFPDIVDRIVSAKKLEVIWGAKDAQDTVRIIDPEKPFLSWYLPAGSWKYVR